MPRPVPTFEDEFNTVTVRREAGGLALDVAVDAIEDDGPAFDFDAEDPDGVEAR
jgi:hypothetical protein